MNDMMNEAIGKKTRSLSFTYRPINFVQQTHKETTEQSIWIRQWLHHVAVGCHCDLA